MLEKSHDSSENHYINQVVRVASAVSLFALIAAVFAVLFPLLKNNEEMNLEKSLSRAQSLAYQIVVIESKNQKAALTGQTSINSDRGPASISQERSLGQDPWGQPYFYKIRKEKTQTRVEIWTTGEHAIKTEVLIPEGYL